MSEANKQANRIMELATGYWRAGALNAAVGLGVFDVLSEPKTLAELAGNLQLDPAALKDLIFALEGLGILKTEGDRVSIPESLAPWLSSGSDTSLLDAMRYNADLFRLWGELPRCLQSGEPVVPIAQLGADPAMTERFVRGMESRGRWLGPQLIPDLDVPRDVDMLDLACGSGIFSRMLKKTRPDLKVTLFDLPGVLEWTRTLWKEADMEDAAEYISGDYRKEKLPFGFDVILYAGALHQESTDSAGALFQKARQSLKPNGSFCVVDIMTSDDRADSVFGNLFSLNMRLLQPHGHVFAVDEVKSLLTASGFTSIEILPPAGYPYRILTATV